MERVTKRRPQNLLESFNFAFEGIIHVLRTQRNMRIHFLVAVVVLVFLIALLNHFQGCVQRNTARVVFELIAVFS